MCTHTHTRPGKEDEGKEGRGRYGEQPGRPPQPGGPGALGSGESRPGRRVAARLFSLQPSAPRLTVKPGLLGKAPKTSSSGGCQTPGCYSYNRQGRQKQEKPEKLPQPSGAQGDMTAT